MSTTETEARAALLARAAAAPVIAVRFQQPEPIGRRHVAAVAMAGHRDKAAQVAPGAIAVDVIEVLGHGVRIARVVPAGEEGAGSAVSAILPWGSVRTLICLEAQPEAPTTEGEAANTAASAPETTQPVRRRGKSAKEGAPEGETKQST